jgi:hypothetical protein
MQQVAVEAIGAQRASEASQALRVPRRDAFCGRTFETRKTSSRATRDRLAHPLLATPEPYISACRGGSCRGRGRGDSAATAAARAARSMSQVPWPMTGTSRRKGPKAALVHACSRLYWDATAEPK